MAIAAELGELTVRLLVLASSSLGPGESRAQRTNPTEISGSARLLVPRTPNDDYAPAYQLVTPPVLSGGVRIETNAY